MKAIFTTAGPGLDAPLDRRFGRAPGFLVYDLESDTFEAFDNRQSLQAAQGAGIGAAQAAIRLGASCVVTGHCGPKAFRALAAAGVEVYSTDAPTVAEALNRLRSGALRPASGPDVAGHWA